MIKTKIKIDFYFDSEMNQNNENSLSILGIFFHITK